MDVTASAPNDRLRGRVALVTGASRGIGAAIARDLAREGATVVINYLDGEGEAESVAADVRALGGAAHLVQADVSEPATATALIEQAIAVAGQLDVLVNNAGINLDRSIRKMTDLDWQRVIDTNLGSVFWCSRAAIQHMVPRATGRIVNIASIIGQTGGFGQANYAAAKAGILGLTKTCALEVARYGITVNAICPGFIETDMLKTVPESVQAGLLQRIPLGRFGRPEEVAACVRFLVTDGSYLTGQALSPNGGLGMM